MGRNVYQKHRLPIKPNQKMLKKLTKQFAPHLRLRIPEDVKEFLTDEQFKLYDLIWKRTVASQMTHATL